MSLRPGLLDEFEFEVSDEIATDVAGSVPRKVLATPRMIQKMERAAMRATRDHLPAGATTVGFEVCVRHVAAAHLGSTCTSRAELVEVVDGRKLRFAVKVTEGGRTIGVGSHERRVVAATGFAPDRAPDR